MILIGIRLFLRATEILSMKVSDFLSEFSCVIEGQGVRALVAHIKGKSDATHHKLALWDVQDPLFKDFDVVTYLLVYVMVFELEEDDFLFPDLNNLERDEAGKPFPVAYKNFLQSIRYLVVKVLNRPEKDSIFGTHILRKTGYLFAVWGVLGTNRDNLSQLTLADIMKGARHKSLSNAAIYAKDCSTFLSWNIRLGTDTNNTVQKWEPIHIENPQAFLGQSSLQQFQNLTLLACAKWYWFKHVNLPSLSVKMNIPAIIQKCHSKQVKDTAISEFSKMMATHLPEASLPAAELLMRRAIQEGIENHIKQNEMSQHEQDDAVDDDNMEQQELQDQQQHHQQQQEEIFTPTVVKKT